MEGGDDGRVVDIDKMTVTLEPDRITKGGLHVPGKDRMEFRPPERKSLLGLDVLAIAKRGSKGDGVFKVPQERNLPSLSALDEDEMSASSGVDDIQTNTSPSRHSYSSQTLSGSFLKFKRDSVFRRVALLSGGDVLGLLLFAAGGRFSHGLPVLDVETLHTADPFIAGWFLGAYFLGDYEDDGKGVNGLTKAVFAAVKSWAVGIPLLTSLVRRW